MISDISILATTALRSINRKKNEGNAARTGLSGDKRRPPSKEDIYGLANENHIAIADALDWFELHKARNFKTEDGKQIFNWKGACTNWCRSMERKRKGEIQ